MEIQEIKNRLTLLEVLTSCNLHTDKNNRLCCPWHNDKTPSLQIYPDTNTWTCFSSNCDAGSGDQIDFIMKYEKLNKYEALLKAKQMLGQEVNTPLDKIAILTKYYQGTLHSMAKSKKGKTYAESRGLEVDNLRIGFCGYDVGKSWNETYKTNAVKIGLDKIKNCLIFPTKNKDNQIVSIYGRSTGVNPRAKHFYLSGGFKGLYPQYPKSETKTLLLTESIIDAATIKQYTDYEVLALYGTNGLTTEHEQAIRDLKQLEEIILFFDGDEAGCAAVEKYAKHFRELDIKVSQVDTPEGEDVNSLVISHESEILTHLIEERKFCFSTEKKEVVKSPAKLHTENAELLLYETPEILITILGGIKITGLDKLKVTLKIEASAYSNVLPIRHSLDLYHSNHVSALTQKISESYELGTTYTERLISELTTALEGYRHDRMEKLKPKKEEKVQLSETEKTEALNYLKDKKLLRNTLKDIENSGLVGETKNALIAYLAYTSRKREKPLHIMCLGASGTGKTYLQEKVGELIPDEDKKEITSLSDNAFYYFGRTELKHKLILIEDLDGAQNVEYPLREIQTKRRISKTVTIKNNTGIPKTINVVVEGPVSVSGCTTREKLYEDNANRCILLYIDDSAEQDKRIMDYQKSASAGLVNTAAQTSIKTKLKNAQRLLRPIKVRNPYAQLIDLPKEVFKPRRTLLLLLNFIETITYYHQYQRAVKKNPDTGQMYIESTKEDIEAAFSLLKEVLFSKSDELSKASRKFLERLKNDYGKGTSFYTQQIRKSFRLSSSSVHRYIRNLQSNGYIRYKGGNKFKGFEYEITDMDEYNKLKSGIDEKLNEILKKIGGVPVSQVYPTSKNGIVEAQIIKDLS